MWRFGLALVSLVGCSYGLQLAPAPSAPRAPGNPDAAMAQIDGVRVTVEHGTWRGSPRDLERLLTPLEVTIENKSDVPVRLSYADFKLSGAHGVTYSALPPYKMAAENGECRPRFAHRSFYVAPYWVPLYRRHGLVGWTGPSFWDPFYYDRYYAWATPLPSPDMLERAIPEGVVESGGFIRGYVYFPKLEAADTPVTFRFNVADARTGESIGQVSLPFTRR